MAQNSVVIGFIRIILSSVPVAMAPVLHAQGESMTLSLECLTTSTSGRVFRVTVKNDGTSPTHVVIGRSMSGGSWVPAVRLSVRGAGAEWDGTRAPGTLGPGRTAGGFSGRIDEVVVPLPPHTAHMTDLREDLFFPKPVPDSAIVSAVLEARPVSTINSGQEDLRLLKVWAGTLVSPAVRVPTDCSSR